jgi:hypothetical protein
VEGCTEVQRHVDEAKHSRRMAKNTNRNSTVSEIDRMTNWERRLREHNEGMNKDEMPVSRA